MTSPDTVEPISAPVFGRRRTEVKRVPFSLCSYDSRDRETVHEFTARAAIDASTALQVNSKDARVQARAIQNLLIRVLVDDDGISRDDKPRRLGSGDEPGTDIVLAGNEWVIGEDEFEKTFPSEGLAAAHADEHGSSLRRFATLMDDPLAFVELNALREIVNHLSEQSAGRPTQPSGGSSRRRTAKRTRR